MRIKYELICTQCLTRYHNTTKCHNDDALLRTDYRKKRIELRDVKGIGKFHDWLPVNELIHCESAPITYKSSELAHELELENLYISFNGYWPERGAFIKTCSFKELEAFPTIQRIKNTGKTLVLASAGNTARAFAHASVLNNVKICIVLPPKGMLRMWLPEEVTDSVHIIQMGKNCDYTDAIHLAERISYLPLMQAEGGARNVARRDGMGTVMLDAVFHIKRMPEHYFQAIGSGTGGIAVWEASLRLLEDGRFGSKLPKLHLAQNLPFAPMYNAWSSNRREIIEVIDMPNPKNLINEMYADILSNRKPPYSVKGGVYDALKSTHGYMYGITNKEAKSAQRLFESLEGIDIFPPAGVAVAALIKAIELNRLNKKSLILLNITGGGLKRLQQEYKLYRLKPNAYAEHANIPLEEIIDVEELTKN